MCHLASPIWVRAHNIISLVGKTLGSRHQQLARQAEDRCVQNIKFPSRLQMVSFQHPLRLGTVIRFGSLEFLSLDIEYDMVFLPPGPLADT